MGNKFIKLMRHPEVDELIKQNHSAFVLLTIIARRAKRSHSLFNNLEIGEALIGDWKATGFETERRYRTAKNDVQKYGLATFKTTNKGTIARLSSTLIYDINEDENDEQSDEQVTGKTTGERRASDEQVTTNKNDNKEKNDKKKKETISRPDGVSESLWNDFLVIRKAKRLPLTQTALIGITREASKINWTIEQAITKCVERGWGGFDSSWVSEKSNNPIPFVKKTKEEIEWEADQEYRRKQQERMKLIEQGIL
jgi:hypothetical protein